MVDENGGASDTGFTTIKPASIDLTAKSPSEKPPRPRAHLPKRLLLLIGFGILLLSAGAVIFILPDWVPDPQLASVTPSVPGATPAVSPRAPAPTAESPWERAQRSELRKQTQEILAELLEAQKNLEEHGVKVWAEHEYLEAIGFAEIGDEHYSRQDFAAALEAYHHAHEQFQRLVDRVDEEFEKTMLQGNQALDDGNSRAAIAAFSVALAIDPLDRAASDGLTSAEKLDELMALVAAGDELLDAEQLEAAQGKYLEASNLDQNSRTAQQKIAMIEDRIRTRDFNRAMSSGFGFLERNQLEQARRAFSEALKIDPNSGEAKTGLEQSRNLIKAARIKSLLGKAQKLEDSESWHYAVTTYDSILKLEPGLAVAQSGKKRATGRAQLHDRLQQLLESPERLFDRSIYDDTVRFHEKIRSMSNRGPVLTRQLTDLTVLMNKANTPVAIKLKSDSLTKVTVYKVGELGYFDTKSLSLRPGRYVAVGTREGFQDVRVEFFVGPGGNLDKPVTIQASRRINDSSQAAARADRG